MVKKVVLVVIDGWGYNKEKTEFDAISDGPTAWMDLFTKKFPSYLIYAHGEHVGLAPDQMGNSEVGHLTIGSGRIIEQDIIRINREISQEKMQERMKVMNEYKNERLHVVGLLSDGGVHSHIDHIKSIVRNVPNSDVLIHAISDGRDTSPKCFLQYYNELKDFCQEINKGKIVSIAGRYYTMDRDNRDERIYESYNMMTKGNFKNGNAESFVADSYEQNISDEFFIPTLFDNDGIILKGEPIIFANFRADRMKQIVRKFEYTNFCFTLTEYDKELKAIAIFEKQEIKFCLSEVLAKHELDNLHVAETEKYAHVTYFFNGGIEHPFKHESRVMVPSLRVASYDLKPEMNVMGVVEEVYKGLQHGYSLIICNFAPPDMVGHTGNYEQTCEAIFATDEALGLVYEACKNFGYTLFITADHGNAEVMRDVSGEPSKKHTTNKVPFIICDGINANSGFFDSDHSLKDIAPTILAYMGIEIPFEMTGKNILSTNDDIKG
ncbi:hypothetical protein COBT_001493 [Conglomerata obtusa]